MARRSVNELRWGRLETPLGVVSLGIGSRGLSRVLLPGDDPPGGGGEGPGTEAAEAELAEYFAAERRAFTVPLDLPAASGFRARVLHELVRVPYGKTVTYAELAARAGNPRAARAAGQACATNPLPIVVPCHRAVGSDGSLRGYAGGVERKRFLLRLEGALGAAA